MRVYTGLHVVAGTGILYIIIFQNPGEYCDKALSGLGNSRTGSFYPFMESIRARERQDILDAYSCNQETASPKIPMRERRRGVI